MVDWLVKFVGSPADINRKREWSEFIYQTPAKSALCHSLGYFCTIGGRFGAKMQV